MPGGRGPAGDDSRGCVVSLTRCSGGGGEVGMVMEGKGDGEQLFRVFVAVAVVIWLLVAPPTTVPSVRGREEGREEAGMSGGGGPRGLSEDTS